MSDATREDALRECPFCGTTPDGSHMITQGGYSFTAYYCPGCKAQGPLVEIGYAHGDERTTGPAAAAWNRRAGARGDARTRARKWVHAVLDAAARAEGFDSFRDSDWSPQVSDIIEEIANALGVHT